MVLKKCEVCKEAHSKYKCPSCLTPYCSLVCYKNHKEIHCHETESSLNPKPNQDSVFTTTAATTAPAAAAALGEASDASLLASASAAVERSPLLVDKPEDVLQQSQLEAIASCSEIREALINNQTLQKIIRQIDSLSEAQIELTNAMDEVDEFYKFIEKIRSVISPN